MPLRPLLAWSLLGPRGRVRRPHPARHRPRYRARFRRPVLEVLEDRTLLSAAQTLAAAPTLVFHNNQATASGYLASAEEADLYRVNLKAGDMMMAAVPAQQSGSTLDGVLRVFDPSGRAFALNNDFDGRDPRLTFQADVTGTYYLGVSAVGNTSYDPRVPDSGTGRSTGLYTLNVTRLQARAALAPDVVGASFQISAATALWGDTLTVRYTIENRGGAAAGTFDAVLALTTDNNLSANLVPLSTVHVSGLAADSAVSGTVTVVLPGSPGHPPAGFAEPATAYLGLLVDAGGAVAGSHQGNNNGLRAGMNEAGLTVLQQQPPAPPNGLVTLGLGAQTSGQLGPYNYAIYEVDVQQAGRLIAHVHATGTAVRLELFDSQARLLTQADGQSPQNPDDVLDVHLDPKGTSASYYLVILELAGRGGGYTLTTEFQPALSPLQALPAGSDPYDMVWADFNGDGVPDLAVADNGSNEVRVFLGNGDGSFQPGRSIAVDNGPTRLVAGDFNGDGRPDLAVLAEGTTGDNAVPGDVVVLLGNGDGTFQSAGAPVTLGSYPQALVAGDFNGDHRLDLVVADEDDSDVRVLLGNGDGTFTAGQQLAVGSYPFALVTGDFNGDGRPDVAVANSGDDTVSVLLGNGDGSFTTGQTLPVGYLPGAAAVGDFNHDGRPDLAVASGDFTGTAPGEVVILLGNGDGTFQYAQTIAVGTHPLSLATADFLGNGQLDLAVADQTSDDVTVLLGNGHGTFRALPPIAVGNLAQAVVAADLNGDGRVDLAAADQNSFDITVVLNDGNLSFRAPPILAVGSDPWSLVAGDFNADGRLDLVSANLYSDNVQMLAGNGDGTLQVAQAEATGTYPYSVVSGDFNGDGRPDLAVADASDNNVRILLGNGDGSFRAVQTLAVGKYPTSLSLGDFNGDGILDLAVTDEDSNDVRILLGKGDGSFRSGQTIAVGSYPLSLVAGHFNGDRSLDLAVAENISDDVQLLLGAGDGTFTLGQSIAVGTNPVSVAAGDVNGDDIPDLVVGDRGSSDVEVLLGQGDGTFQATQTIPLGTNVSSVALGDFTGTGRLDLVATDQPGGTASILVNDGQGSFQVGQTIPVGQGAVSTAVGDFNGDGRLDIAVADAWAGTLTMLLGNGDDTFGPLAGGQGLGPAPSRPVPIDVNGDGTLDLVTDSQSGQVLYRQGVPGSPGTFQSPIVINPADPARDEAVVRTALGPRIAVLDAAGSALTLFALQPDGTFAPVQTLAVPGGNAARVAVAALSGPRVDLAVTTALTNQVLVYTQQADGTFAGPTNTLAADLDPSAILPADLYGTGSPDLVVASQSSGDVTVYDPQQSFTTVERFPVGMGPYGQAAGASELLTLAGTRTVLAGRFDEADPMDLLALSSSGQVITLLRGTGQAGGVFDPQVVLNLGFQATDMVAGTFGGDTHLDLAFLDAADRQVVVYRGDGTGSFVRWFATGAGSAPGGLTLSDINGDGMPDLLIGSRAGDVLILIGQKNATFKPSFVHVERNLALATFTASDGTLRFVSADEAQNRVLLQDASGNTTVLADASNGLDAPSAVRVADLNGDGLPDLLVANSGSSELLVFLGTGPGQFAPAPLHFAVGSTPAGITVADLNRDGIPDVVVANEGSNTLSLLFGQGSGGGWTLVSGPQLLTGAGPVATVVADVTGPTGKPDGIPDITVSDSHGNDVRVLRGLGFGYFADAQPVALPTGSGPGPLFLGHFSDSGRDLVTVNLLSSTLSVFAGFPRHVAAGTLPTSTLSSGGQGPVAAAVGDFNGDGYSDLIVANRSGTIAVFEGGPTGLTLFEKLTVSIADVTSLAFGTGGTILVGGLGGVVSVALQPVGSAAVVAPNESFLTVGDLTANPAPAAAETVFLVAAPLVVPAATQTSGTAGMAESAAVTTSGSATSGLEALGASANQASVAWVDAPLSLPDEPSPGDDVAASLLTGAKPTTRLLPQRKGGSAAAVATITREEDSGGDPNVADDAGQTPSLRVIGLNYRNVRRAPRQPANAPAEKGKPPRAERPRQAVQSRLPALETTERQPDRDARVVEGLALALLAAAVGTPGNDPRQQRASGLPTGSPGG